MLEHIPLVNNSIVLLPLQGVSSLQQYLVWLLLKCMTTVGLTSLLHLLQRHFPKPLMGASTSNKLQNRQHLNGTARFVGTHLPACGVKQEGSQPNSSQVWSCHSY